MIDVMDPLTAFTHLLAAEGIPVPLSPDWAPTLLVALVWLLAAAMVVGPVVRYFRGEPRSSEAFSDDPPPAPRR
jgi:hypothetical protein